MIFFELSQRVSAAHLLQTIVESRFNKSHESKGKLVFRLFLKNKICSTSAVQKVISILVQGNEE